MIKCAHGVDTCVMGACGSIWGGRMCGGTWGGHVLCVWRHMGWTHVLCVRVEAHMQVKEKKGTKKSINEGAR